jgi:hypothetical protein
LWKVPTTPDRREVGLHFRKNNEPTEAPPLATITARHFAVGAAAVYSGSFSSYACYWCSRSCNMGVGAQQVTAEAVGELFRVALLPELKLEARLPAREKGDLEQDRLYRLTIEPGPHLAHGRGQVGVTMPNLDNVHRSTTGMCFSLRCYIGRRPMLAMSSFAAIRGATYRNQHVGDLFFFKC